MSNYFTSAPEEKPIKAVKQKNTNFSFLVWVLKNCAVIISVILMLITAFILFVATFDLSGTTIQENALSATTIFIACVSYVLYINGYTIGEDLTEKNIEIKSIYEKYNAKLWHIRDNNLINDLDAFIKEYKITEYNRARENILLSANLTLDDYNQIIAGNFRTLTGNEEKAVKKAKKLKPIKLSRQMILNVSAANARRNPIKSKTTIELHKWLKFIFRLFRTILTTIFIISVTINMLLHNDMETILHSVLVFTLIVLSFISGLSAGRKIKLEYAERTQDILNFFDEFFDWRSAKPKT